MAKKAKTTTEAVKVPNVYTLSVIARSPEVAPEMAEAVTRFRSRFVQPDEFIIEEVHQSFEKYHNLMWSAWNQFGARLRSYPGTLTNVVSTIGRFCWNLSEDGITKATVVSGNAPYDAANIYGTAYTRQNLEVQFQQLESDIDQIDDFISTMQELKYRMLADKQELAPIMEMMRKQFNATVSGLDETDKRTMGLIDGTTEAPKRWA